MLLVATIGAAQLLLFLQYVLPDISTYSAFPTAFTRQWTVGSVVIRADHLVAIVVFPLLVFGLAWFLNRTKHGVAVRAAADNPDAARIAGISVKRVSTIVWSLAGAFAAVATILSAPFAGANVASTVDVGPGILIRALAAAVIAAMASLWIALGAAVVLGIVEAISSTTTPPTLGSSTLFCSSSSWWRCSIVSLRTKTLGMRESFSFAPRVRPVPPNLQHLWWVRHYSQLGAGLALAAAVALPLLVESPSRHFLYARVLLMALVALSLTVLTGWAGQLSLGQFALVGLGGMSTYSLVQHRVAFPAALLLGHPHHGRRRARGGRAGTADAGLCTSPSRRSPSRWPRRGCSRRPIFLDADHVSPMLRRPVVAGTDLASQRTYYFLCLVLLVLAIAVVARVRRSGLGRSLLAVRDNELAAAAVGLSPTRTKLFAFALSGGLAGIAGGALVGLFVQFTPEQFQATQSLTVVAVAVVGGLSSITGTILGSLVVVGLPTFFPDSPQVALLTSGVGMLVLLLYFPGGLVQILYNVRDVAFDWLARRQPAAAPEAPRPSIAVSSEAIASRPPLKEGLAATLAIADVTVRFGHRTVVDEVSLAVHPGEVVGLIGSNGAGKSTLMNAIGGLPSLHRRHRGAGSLGPAPARPPASCPRTRPHLPGRRACSPT